MPLTGLSSDLFEDFTYQVLVKLGAYKGFELMAGRQPSGDQGYDCTAIRNDGGLVCIQCKRYSDTLYTDTVIEELIKVALDGAVNGNSPKEHYIITASDVSGKLRVQLRQKNYIDIKELCREKLQANKYNSEQLIVVKGKGLDPYSLVVNYLDSLDKLFIWSSIDFGNELGVIWSEISHILDRFFVLELAFKEHPRPDFNIKKYISNKLQKNNFVSLDYSFAALPNKFESIEEYNGDGGPISLDGILSCLRDGRNIVLSSAGGSGKTTTISVIEHLLLKQCDDFEYLPVRIDLRGYSRNVLKRKINEVLGINYGSWMSLPYKFVYLFDGLDEMLETDTQAFVDEIELLGISGFIITLRDVGLNILTRINKVDFCIKILPISYRTVFDFARINFNGEELSLFCDEYRGSLGRFGREYLSLPFFMSMTMDFFKFKNNLPQSINDLLDHWLEKKLDVDRSKIRSENLKISKIPKGLIKNILSLLVYNFRVRTKLVNISTKDFEEGLLEVFKTVENDSSINGVIGFDDLLSMVTYYEIFREDFNGYYYCHLIIADYLAAAVFSENWRKFNSEYHDDRYEDLWLFTAMHISDDEKKNFLNYVFSFNILLGANVAKKYGGEYLLLAEEILFDLVQGDKYLEKSKAIFALGVLGTDNSIARLKYLSNISDHHYSFQCLRSLAINGHKETLLLILQDNELKSQMPAKISGGTYSLWFNSPPQATVDIVRSRLHEWITDKNIPLCFSLRTLAYYGDFDDVESLKLVMFNTSELQEFYDAFHALNVISHSDLVSALIDYSVGAKKFSFYYAKSLLISLGSNVDISEEFNFFLECTNYNEDYIVNSNLYYFLGKIADLIIKTELSIPQKNRFIETYKSMRFANDFFYWNLFHHIAASLKLYDFLEIVIDAFKNEDASEIHQAFQFVNSLQMGEIPNELKLLINAYEAKVDKSSYGIKLDYIKYNIKMGLVENAAGIANDCLIGLLDAYDFPSASYEKVMEYFTWEHIIYSILQEFTSMKNLIDEEAILKLLLLNSRHYANGNDLKQFFLKELSPQKIKLKLSEVCDEQVDVFIRAYLAEIGLLDFSNDDLSRILDFMFANHFNFPSLKKICSRLWSDEFSQVFLNSFACAKWNPVTVQVFEDYVFYFSGLITKSQIELFENKRGNALDNGAERIYLIWLESKGCCLSR